MNVLYNGISTGPQSITSRVDGHGQPRAGRVPQRSVGADVRAQRDRRLGQLRQPAADHGPIQNELDLSLDSFGSPRSHFGSGGSTAVQGLDYRFDAIGSRINSFIDGDYRDLTDLSAQLNYHVTDTFKTFGAIEYKKDSGHAYWGTPLVPTSFAGAHAVSGVVSGTAISTFSTARSSGR